MKKRYLGKTKLEVSEIGLGTMTFGNENNPEESMGILDTAFENGINFIDTAELYPVPPRMETQGASEVIIGEWLKRSRNRHQVVLASKVTGREIQGENDHIRKGSSISKKMIEEALESSLRRLNTDYLDLYQLHWPVRPANYFGQLNYQNFDQNTKEELERMEEVLEAFVQLKQKGYIRHFGVSNETPWGLMQYQYLSKINSWPCIASVQNPFNLLNQSFEIGMGEVCYRENIGFLPYSPLAFGKLTGKFLNGKAGNKHHPYFSRYGSTPAMVVSLKYIAIAYKFGIKPVHMALKYIMDKPYVTSVLIGATHPDQVIENVKSAEIMIPAEAIKEINEVYKEYQNVCP